MAGLFFIFPSHKKCPAELAGRFIYIAFFFLLFQTDTDRTMIRTRHILQDKRVLHPGHQLL